MAQRRSVLEPKPKVVYADDRTLVPRLNWLSWRTWAVFLGFNLGFAATVTIVLFSCAYVQHGAAAVRLMQKVVGIGEDGEIQ